MPLSLMGLLLYASICEEDVDGFIGVLILLDVVEPGDMLLSRINAIACRFDGGLCCWWSLVPPLASIKLSTSKSTNVLGTDRMDDVYWPC